MNPLKFLYISADVLSAGIPDYEENTMRGFIFILVLLMAGCQQVRQSLETGASTTALANSPVIEKVDLNIKYRMEW